MSGTVGGRAGSGVAELVQGARDGEQTAWEGLVERYLPLVLSVVRRYRLDAADGADVNQTVWLRLVEHLDHIREPERLPGWIVTTARNEALRLLAARGRTVPVDPLAPSGLQTPTLMEGLDEDLLREERHRALREGLDDLRPAHRELLLLLLADPPLSYDEISARLQIPRGSIGPTRGRALAELRNTPAIRGFIEVNETGRGRGR